MVPTGKLQAARVRAPIPVLALLAGLVTLFGFGINFGESVVGRTAPARHDHDGRGSATRITPMVLVDSPSPARVTCCVPGIPDSYPGTIKISGSPSSPA